MCVELLINYNNFHIVEQVELEIIDIYQSIMYELTLDLRYVQIKLVNICNRCKLSFVIIILGGVKHET